MLTFDQLPCPVLVTDRGGTALAVNHSLCELLGAEPDHWLAKPLDLMFQMASRIFLQSYVWPMLYREGQVREIQLQVKGAGGEAIPVFVNCQKTDGDGSERFTWVFFVSTRRSRYERDLLEARQRAETVSAALAKSERFVRTVADALPSLISYWDRTLQCQFANQPHLEWFGHTPQEMKGMALSAVLGAALFAQNAPFIEGALAGVPQEFERSVRRANGSQGHALVNYIPDMGAHGTPQGFFAFMTDITDLKAINEHLEQRVLERTSELALVNQDLLVQAQIADKANLAKSDFLANMSHEIRTPLSAVSGMARLIADEPLSALQQARMDKLQNAVRHLKLIINDILDLAKIEANKLVLDQAPVDIAALVESVVSMVQAEAQAKGLQLHLAIDATPAQLVGDPTRIGQALLNYLVNAIKFTASGAVTVRVAALEETADTALLRFEVEDTGMGIAAEQLAALFEPFVQADNTTTRKFGGTGLGLAIAKRLAQAMQGAVGAHSEPGTGSVFWFTARLAKATQADFAHSNPAELEAIAVLNRDYAGYPVLLAEDDEFNREIGTILLQHCGLQVDVAVDGLEAVRMASQKHYALILMDMQMPNLDGLEATRRIRQQHPAHALPIIAMTANAFAEDKENCLRAGMNDFITKPVDPQKLHQAMLRQFSRA